MGERTGECNLLVSRHHVIHDRLVRARRGHWRVLTIDQSLIIEHQNFTLNLNDWCLPVAHCWRKRAGSSFFSCRPQGKQMVLLKRRELSVFSTKSSSHSRQIPSSQSEQFLGHSKHNEEMAYLIIYMKGLCSKTRKPKTCEYNRLVISTATKLTLDLLLPSSPSFGFPFTSSPFRFSGNEQQNGD